MRKRPRLAARRRSPCSVHAEAVFAGIRALASSLVAPTAAWSSDSRRVRAGGEGPRKAFRHIRGTSVKVYVHNSRKDGSRSTPTRTSQSLLCPVDRRKCSNRLFAISSIRAYASVEPGRSRADWGRRSVSRASGKRPERGPGQVALGTDDEKGIDKETAGASSRQPPRVAANTPYTNRPIGSSSSPLSSCRKRAAVAPSMAR